MIKSKNKVCIECGRNDLPHFSKKRCMYCSQKAYAQPKKITKKTSDKRKERSKDRDVYFAYHIERCTHSEEDGSYISEPSRLQICHIFSKSQHPSLQSNLDNVIYLQGAQHSILDNRLFKNEFEKLETELPNAWKIICERFIKLKPLCLENTRFVQKLSEYLGID